MDTPLAALVRAQLKKRDEPPYKFASRIGIERNTIYAILNGTRSDITLKVLVKIAHGLDTGWEYIVGAAIEGLDNATLVDPFAD